MQPRRTKAIRGVTRSAREFEKPVENIDKSSAESNCIFRSIITMQMHAKENNVPPAKQPPCDILSLSSPSSGRLRNAPFIAQWNS
jgi:hypothetical protein